MKRVNCLGIAVMDALSGPLEAYPVPRVRTQVTTESVRFIPGGGSVNTASALARMGISAGVFSKIGDDLSGDFMLQELREIGVDVSGIAISPCDWTTCGHSIPACQPRKLLSRSRRWGRRR